MSDNNQSKRFLDNLTVSGTRKLRMLQDTPGIMSVDHTIGPELHKLSNCVGYSLSVTFGSEGFIEREHFDEHAVMMRHLLAGFIFGDAERKVNLLHQKLYEAGRVSGDISKAFESIYEAMK